MILVTGGGGQVATSLAALADGRALRRVGRPEFDFDAPEGIAALLRAVKPDLIVNAAAYTAVDKAESEPEAAMRANRDGPALLAKYCGEAGIPLIHISTDYVFDGRKGAPYVERDTTAPTGVYGATKLAGERAVLENCKRAIILRTSWVYAAMGRNFVLTMLNAAARTNKLRVVADQKGCPTAADDLAGAILAIADKIALGWRNDYAGVYHATGSGETTWHGLASEVFAVAERHGQIPPVVEAIATADWPTPAQRPADSRLDCNKLAMTFGLKLPDWRDAVARVVTRVFAERKASRAGTVERNEL